MRSTRLPPGDLKAPNADEHLAKSGETSVKRYGLAKSERISDRADFLKVSRGAVERLETRNFLVLLRPNRLSQVRLGVTVTKKIGNAVQRNRLKRYVREFFRLNKHHLPPDCDMVIIARRGAGDLDQYRVNLQLQIIIDFNLA